MMNQVALKPIGLSKPTPPIAFFCDSALTAEGLRVAAQVRIAHLAKDGHKDPNTERALTLFIQAEDFVDDQLKEWVDKHPTAPWWTKIKGDTGKGLPRQVMGKVIGSIDSFGKYYPVGDPMIPIYIKREPIRDDEDKLWVWVDGIERLATPSKLFKLAGLLPGMKREAGKKLDYNDQLKTMLYRLMLYGFMMTRNPYFQRYQIYKTWKTADLTAKGIRIIPTPSGRWCTTCEKNVVTKASFYCPDCQTKLSKKEEPPGVIFEGHLDNMCRRWTIKLFLSHLWVVYRAALNLPSRQPYPIEKMPYRHSTIIDPWEMVSE